MSPSTATRRPCKGNSHRVCNAASVESVPTWDSLAAVTLIAVLEQEFDTQIDLMELPELTSYQAVRDYLASRGVEPSRMRTISYGKARPVAVCDNISCWSQNRRAVSVLNATS